MCIYSGIHYNNIFVNGKQFLQHLLVRLVRQKTFQVKNTVVNDGHFPSKRFLPSTLLTQHSYLYDSDTTVPGLAAEK